MKYYFKLPGGAENGPVSSTELKKMARAGTLSRDSLIRKEVGSGTWHAATSVSGLSFAQPPSATGPGVRHATPRTAGERPNAKWIVATAAAGVMLSVATGIVGYWAGSSSAPDSTESRSTFVVSASPRPADALNPAPAAEDAVASPAQPAPPAPAPEVPQEPANAAAAIERNPPPAAAEPPPAQPPVPTALAALREAPEPGRPVLGTTLSRSLEASVGKELDRMPAGAVEQLFASLRRSDLEPADVQRKALKGTVAELKASDQVKAGSALGRLVERLDGHVSKLEQWTKSPGAGGRKLSLEGNLSASERGGYAGLRWGPLPGWGADVSSLDLGNGRVFTRVGTMATDPEKIRMLVTGQPPARQPCRIMPSLERIPLEYLAIFERQVAATADKTGSDEVLVVVGGELVMASRRLTLPTAEDESRRGEILVDAARQDGKDLVARLGSPDRLSMQMPTHFQRWSSEEGEVVILCADKLSPSVGEVIGDRYLDSSIMKGGGWKVLPGAVFSSPWSEELRGALGALSEKARSIVGPLKVSGKDRLVIISMGIETTKGQPLLPGMDGPSIQLVDSGGRQYDDLGGDMAMLCMMTLTNATEAADPELPSPMDPAAYRTFLVPADARGLEVRIKGAKKGIALPSPIDLSGIDKQPFRSWVELPWSEIPPEDAEKFERLVLNQLGFAPNCDAKIDALPKPSVAPDEDE